MEESGVEDRRLAYKLRGGVVDLPRGRRLETEVLEFAVQETNRLFEELHSVAPYVFEILGMRNLSAFVGEAFAAEIAKASDGELVPNPHQDGYPDLLLMDESGERLWFSVESQWRDKAPFSPFKTGGMEVKATCGDVPTETKLERVGRRKPAIGEQRVDIINGVNWKAHHRDTNNLMGIVWDFIGGLPAIGAVTYSAELTVEDWGNIVKPRDGGGRTTSVSIMNRGGVSKMFSNTVLCLPGPYQELVERFAKPGRGPR
jgi:hypothetical protein